MSGVDQLAQRFELWRLAWNSDDPNCIVGQVVTLVWDAAVYGLINECRRPTDSGKRPKLNGAVQNFIDRSFAAAQFARMRRLVDDEALQASSASASRSDRSVFSIRSIINDMRRCRESLSRRNIFELKGFEYSIDEVERRELDFILAHESGTGILIPPEHCSSRVRDLHELWDRLCGVSPSERSEDDAPRDAVFLRMLSELDKLAPAREWATIYVAHSASRSSREGREASVTFAQLDEMTKAVVQVCGAISELIFDTHMANWLAQPDPGLTEHLDKPWVDETGRQRLEIWWGDYESRVNSWRSTDYFLLDSVNETCS